MPSTYTSNNGIEKIGTGEQSGTWGSTTNTNFDIIDRALNGVGAITLSGTSHTLTTSDGSASDGHYKVLVLGGSPTGTNTVTISPNDQDKLYFVYNTTSQTATFSQGSGANASIAAGDAAIIYADGAGAGAAVTNLTDQLAISSGGSSNFSALQVGSVDVVDLSSAQTLTNKTLTDAVANTQSASDNSTKVATTAYVDNATGTLGTMSSQNASSVNITGGTIAGASLSSTVTGATATTGDSDTSIATTAFVQQEITANAYTLPAATQTTLGGVKIYTSGGDLYIVTT